MTDDTRPPWPLFNAVLYPAQYRAISRVNDEGPAPGFLVERKSSGPAA